MSWFPHNDGLTKEETERRLRGMVDALTLQVQWLYKNRVEGHSIRQLAREDKRAAEDEDSARKRVREGIEKADKLLNVAVYGFAQTPGGTTT